MAQTIQLKHSYSTGSWPTSLADGEVAINLADHQFWVGSGSVSASALKLEQITASGFSASQVIYGKQLNLAGQNTLAYANGIITVGNAPTKVQGNLNLVLIGIK